MASCKMPHTVYSSLEEGQKAAGQKSVKVVLQNFIFLVMWLGAPTCHLDNCYVPCQTMMPYVIVVDINPNLSPSLEKNEVMLFLLNPMAPKSMS